MSRFLGRHYGLRKYVPQENNYVVFDDYFNHDDTFDERYFEDKAMQAGQGRPVSPVYPGPIAPSVPKSNPKPDPVTPSRNGPKPVPTYSPLYSSPFAVDIPGQEYSDVKRPQRAHRKL